MFEKKYRRAGLARQISIYRLMKMQGRPHGALKREHEVICAMWKAYRQTPINA